jgi:hypothetical protein
MHVQVVQLPIIWGKRQVIVNKQSFEIHISTTLTRIEGISKLELLGGAGFKVIAGKMAGNCALLVAIS